jgi:flagellar basal body P-ring formation protein FlgA
MIRAAVFASLVVFAVPAAAQVTGALPPRPVPTLRATTIVTSDLVRIGDLVDNAGAAASVPIFRSPDYGTTGAVPVAQVLDAIRAHDLVLVDTGNVSEIAVTRAGRAISVKEIEDRIARAFAGRVSLGEAKSLAVRLDREARPILLDPSASGELQVARSYYDPPSGRFDVVFELSAASGRLIRRRYTGALVEMADVAILTHSLGRGDIVRNSDIAIERRPRADVPGDIVTSADQVVGSAAKQALRAGYALRRADVMKPELVHRDEVVTLVYEVPGLLLTMRGKALDSGTEGDLVSVLNVQSKRTIQGYVSGPGRISIPAAANFAAIPVPAGERAARPVSE